MGFSTSAVFIILVTAGIAAGLGLQGILNAYSDSVESAGEEQSDRMAEQIYTDIVILNFSASANATYDFSTGAQVDKWAAWKKDELTNPPSTGPFIDGEENFGGGDYTDIQTSNDNRADTDIDNGEYATHHFLFTISEDPATIYNLSVLWEGYGKQYPSYVYIWNYDASDWELIGIGTSIDPNSENIVSKDLTVSSADPAVYLEAGNLHLVATSYESGGKQKLYTDYVRVFISMGGLWVKNIGETTLDPSYAVLFDNYEYIDSSTYSANVDGDYWDPTEVLRIAYNALTSISHLFKVTTGNGISDSYYYAP